MYCYGQFLHVCQKLTGVPIHGRVLKFPTLLTLRKKKAHKNHAREVTHTFSDKSLNVEVFSSSLTTLPPHLCLLACLCVRDSSCAWVVANFSGSVTQLCVQSAPHLPAIKARVNLSPGSLAFLWTIKRLVDGH